MTRVLVQQIGRRVDLDPSDVIGDGGEATIYKVTGQPELAVKIYHQPSPHRAEKLQAFLDLHPQLPVEVIVPTGLVFDEAGRQIIGLTQKRLTFGYQVMESLFNRKHRETYGIGTESVAGLFLKLHPILDALHHHRIIVGDLNPHNELYLKTDLALIDTDSFQFGQFPCPVATERCLDPRLYGIDLSQRPSFITDDDWYAYMVLLFNSLLLVHPYGGAHRQIRTLPKRAMAKVTVLDPSVTYPANAYKPEILSDPLLQEFERMFGQGRRGRLALEILRDYHSQLTTCPTCRLQYPVYRKQCPGCLADNLKAQKAQKDIRGAQVFEIFKTDGPIVFFKIMQTGMYAIAIEKDQAVLYTKKTMQAVEKKTLFKTTLGTRYDMFDHYLVVAPNPHDDTPRLYIMDVQSAAIQPVTVSSTQRFAGRTAVFRGAGRFLYRLTGGVLQRAQIPFGNDLIDEMVATGVEHQTWIDAAEVQGVTYAIGYYRIFNRYDWFLVHGTRLLPINLPPLANGESLLDRSVRFSDTSALILRRTKRSGQELIHLDVVDLNTGNIRTSGQLDLINEDWLSDIHACAFNQGVVIGVGIEGLTAYNVMTKAKRTFEVTSTLADPGDHLWKFEDGILVVGNQMVKKIVLRN